MAKHRPRPAAARPAPPSPPPERRRAGLDLLVGAVLVAVALWWGLGRASRGRSPQHSPPSDRGEFSRAPTRPGGPPPPLPLTPASSLGAAVAEPAPPAEAIEQMPSGTCPLDDHALGSPPLPATVSLDWYTSGSDFERVQQEQRASGLPLVLYVFTDWCPYCREFEKEVLAAVDVERYLRDNAVKLKLNPESGSRDAAVAHRLGVDGFPSFLVAMPDEQPDKLALHQDERWIRPGDLVATIELRVSRWASRAIAAAAADRDARRRDLGSIELSLTQALRARPDEPRGYLERARVFAAQGSTDAALDDLARLDALAPGRAMAYEGVEEVLEPLARWDEVIACWSRFIEVSDAKAHGHLARARALARKGLAGLARADAATACRLGAAAGCAALTAGR